MIFSRILAATDGTEVAHRAVGLAARLAQRDGAELVVVTAVSVPQHVAVAANLNPRAIQNYVERLGSDYLTPDVTLLRELRVGSEVKIVVGPPADALIQEIETLRPDLVVLGRGSRMEPGALLLGSVSHRVAQHVKVPVLLVS